MLLHVALLAYRTLNEEKMLFAELDGYDQYEAEARYRFVPGVW